MKEISRRDNQFILAKKNGVKFLIEKKLDKLKGFGYLNLNWNHSKMKISSKEDLIGKLKEKGFKITSQRLAIIDALLENHHAHPGATLIFNEARKKANHVSLSTVYATLKEFSENGLIRQLEFDRMENRYDGNLSDHINLICKRCGKIIDYDIPTLFEPKDITRKSGFIITDARMECHGYCRDCLKRPE